MNPQPKACGVRCNWKHQHWWWSKPAPSHHRDNGADLPLPITRVKEQTCFFPSLGWVYAFPLYPLPLLLGQKPWGDAAGRMEAVRLQHPPTVLAIAFWQGLVSLLPWQKTALPWSQWRTRQNCMAESKGWLDSEIQRAVGYSLWEMEETSLAGLYKTRLWNTRHSTVGNNAALSERWTQLLNRSLLFVSCYFPFKNIYSDGLFLMGRQSILKEARHLEGRGGRNCRQANAWFAFCRACSSGHGESWGDIADFGPVTSWSPGLIGLTSFSLLIKDVLHCFSSARLWSPGLLVVGLWSHRQYCRCCTGHWLLVC